VVVVEEAVVKSVCGLGFDMKKLDIKGVMVEVWLWWL
jgi:hypothetical protein